MPTYEKIRVYSLIKVLTVQLTFTVYCTKLANKLSHTKDRSAHLNNSHITWL